MIPPIRDNVDLTHLNTLGLKSTAARYAEISSRDQIEPLIEYAEKQGLRILWLGGGSNLVLGEYVSRLVVRVALMGRQFTPVDSETIDLYAGAGENWHELVLACSEAGAHGLENLALIPGTVGASPVQNIGAYGVEVGDFIRFVDLYDREKLSFERIPAQDCHFAYRDSIFKQQAGRFLILGLSFRLKRNFSPQLSYPALQDQLRACGIKQPSSQQMIAAVCAVRRSKLPDPETLGNAGSFFKNPVVDPQEFKRLSEQHPGIPHYEAVNGIKLAAGWLVEQSGWKGRSLGPVAMYDKQALVLVNRGGAVRREVRALRDAVVADVESRFGIRLEQEPICCP